MANTTWNPSDKSVGITLSGLNLIATNNNNTTSGARATDRQITGKFYWEYTCNTFTNTASGVGIASSTANLTFNIATLQLGVCAVRQSTGAIHIDGNAQPQVIGAITSGTVVCVAVDCAARLIWFRSGAAGNWNGSGTASPATGVGGVTLLTNLTTAFPIYPLVITNATNEQVTANFGDTAFTGAVPAGFTSGFTAGATINTNALATQVATEHWLTTSPQSQVTQVAVEHWATVADGVYIPPPSGANVAVMVLA